MTTVYCGATGEGIVKDKYLFSTMEQKFAISKKNNNEG